MPSTTDAELRAIAEQNLLDAQTMMGLPAPETAVSGDYWHDVAERGRNLLKKAWRLPTDLGTKVGLKLRDAMRSGLDKASDASASARQKLGVVASLAALLAASPGIMIGLLAFALIEGTGWGGRARSAGRRYVSRRARSYGF